MEFFSLFDLSLFLGISFCSFCAWFFASGMAFVAFQQGKILETFNFLAAAWIMFVFAVGFFVTALLQVFPIDTVIQFVLIP